MATHSCDIQAGTLTLQRLDRLLKKHWPFNCWQGQPVPVSSHTSARYHSCRPQRLHCTPCTLCNPPPTAPRSTPTFTHRDCLQAIWEKFGPQFVLQVPIINEHHHCFMVKPAFFSSFQVCFKLLVNQRLVIKSTFSIFM